MNDPRRPAPTAPIHAPRTAMLFGGLLLAGLAALTIFARIDQSRLAQREHFEENTAAGDTRYFAIPADPPQPPPAAVILNGRALYPVNDNAVKKPDDSRMWRAGRDEATGLSIYQERELRSKKKKPSSSPEPERYFLKAGPGEYLEVRPAVPAKQASYFGSKKRWPGATARALPAEFFSRMSVYDP